jgi:hypothetical protein
VIHRVRVKDPIQGHPRLHGSRFLMFVLLLPVANKNTLPPSTRKKLLLSCFLRHTVSNPFPKTSRMTPFLPNLSAHPNLRIIRRDVPCVSLFFLVCFLQCLNIQFLHVKERLCDTISLFLIPTLQHFVHDSRHNLPGNTIFIF